MQYQADVIVVGGGVIGCSIAFYLSREGVSVTLIDRDGLAAGASGVAAGMLTPVAEHVEGGPLYDLGLASLAMFPDTLQVVHSESGIDPEYVTSGTLRVAFAEDEAEALKSIIPRVTPKVEADWLTETEVQSIEPKLSQEILGGLFTPGERQVRGLRLTQGFAQAASAQPGRTKFLFGTQVMGLTYMGERVTGVRLSDGTSLSADHVVIAAGSWSGQLTEDLPSGDFGAHVRVPVRPVRGQLVNLHSAPRLIRTNVWWGKHYLTPKVDGTTVVGATQEEAGFDTRSTAEGVVDLLTAGLRMLPELAYARMDGVSVGLRPGTPDDMPIIGRVPGYEGIWLATGHFRSGILLSPITGQIIAELITTGKSSFPIDAFSLARFE